MARWSPSARPRSSAPRHRRDSLRSCGISFALQEALMHIDIVSDVICPWCFIGKRRLGRALEQRPDLTVSVTWRAFQLNPDMPEGGMARADYLAAKFGNSAHAGRIYAAITAAGAGENIAFAFDRIRRTPNTRHPHRLIRYATLLGKADALVETLFNPYFSPVPVISNHATLPAYVALT